MKHLFLLMMFAAVLSACGDNGTDTTETVTTVTDDAAVDAMRDALTEAAADQNTGEYAGFAGDIIYGNPDADIEVIEYASMTCPHCANFATNIFPQVEEKYIETGKIKFVFRNLVANRLDLAATVAARCGGENAAGALVKEIFARQQEWGRAQDPITELASIVRKAGVSRTKLDQCLRDRGMHEELVKITQEGFDKYNVTGTPTIIIDGQKLDGYAFDKIDEVLSKK